MSEAELIEMEGRAARLADEYATAIAQSIGTAINEGTDWREEIDRYDAALERIGSDMETLIGEIRQQRQALQNANESNAQLVQIIRELKETRP